MTELLRNAWLGWNRYTDNGKFAALLIVTLLYFGMLWMPGLRDPKRGKGPFFHASTSSLLIYTLLMTVVCVCPLTAVFLMLYQTRFYDYEWIWNLVPVNLVIALGGTVFLDRIWKDYKRSKSLLVTAAVVAVIFLSGSLGLDVWHGGAAGEERTRAESVLEQMTDALGRSDDICLWAPADIMECARAYSGQIRLVYGRNMWDAALGAYSYETYDAVREEMYQWMIQTEWMGTLECPAEILVVDEAGGTHRENRVLDGLNYIQNARGLGVNCILLADSMQAGELERIRQETAAEIVSLDGYYLVRME